MTLENFKMDRINPENLNNPMYFGDIDTPVFDFLNKPIITKNYLLQPLGNEHFLDLFEFRLQNEPLESDPFDKLGEKFEDAYTQFFTYMCNVDNLAWVLLDRTFIVGFFLLEIDVDYNKYMERNAHLYYELSHHLKGVELNAECIKGVTDRLFGESDIPKIELHLDEDDNDRDCMAALERLGFIRTSEKDNNTGSSYIKINDDPILLNPPRHMPYILKSYQDAKLNADIPSAFN